MIRSIDDETDYLPARMINEVVYCPRLFYYEHVEGVFVDNRETVEGSLRHDRVVTRYHDLAGMQTVVSTAYAYDPLGRLTDLTHSQGATTLADYGWTYDAFSRITSFTSLADGTSNYSYDDTNQLTTADHSSQTDENYSYDANGNRTNGDYSTGTNNQLVSDGTYNYTYDDEGNRLTQTTIATGEAKEYEWDYRNRLVGITYLTAAGGTTTKRVAYDYDAFDRRIAKHVDDTGGGTFNRGERYVYDGEHVALVFDHTGALLNRFLHNPQVIDQILADEQFEPAMAGEMPTAPGNVIWPLADNLGTIRDLAEYDDTLGITDIVNHRVYDSFGEIISETDPTVDHQFGFTGRDWGSDAGLYYYRARWYDARVGRFVSEDPIGFDADDRNLSRYVGNNPTTATDPSGHELQPAVFLYPAEGARGFGWNELNRVVTMIVYVHFKAAEGDPDIDQKVLDDFGKKVENFTEKTFNANAVWIVPSAPPCVRWKPRLNVVLTDNPRGIDITVASVHDQSGTNSDDPNNITGNWDTLDVTFREGQYSAVHEMGHVIGLRHPGKDNGYDADPSALMGYGMQLRTVYFHSWAERLNRVEPAQAPWIPLGPPAPAPIPDRPRRYP